MLTPRHTRCDGARPRLSHALLSLLGALSGLGCGSDADLPKQYLGDSSETSGSLQPNEGDSPAAADNVWSCLGQAPVPLPQRANTPVGFVLPLVDWTTRAPLAGRGLFATLCSNLDFSCSTPLGSPYVVQDRMLGSIPLPAGAAGVPVLEGFDGYIKFDVTPTFGDPESQRFMPADYYLGGIVSGDISQGPPLLMLTRGARDILLQQSFPSVDPGLAAQTGMVMVTVGDCRGNVASDVRVEILVSGDSVEGATRFVVPSSRIPIEVPAGEPLVTGISGVVGFLGVPQGFVQLRAFRRGDTEPFGTTELGSVAGEISVGVLRPAYLNSANFSGYAPLSP